MANRPLLSSLFILAAVQLAIKDLGIERIPRAECCVRTIRRFVAVGFDRFGRRNLLNLGILARFCRFAGLRKMGDGWAIEGTAHSRLYDVACSTHAANCSNCTRDWRSNTGPGKPPCILMAFAETDFPLGCFYPLAASWRTNFVASPGDGSTARQVVESVDSSPRLARRDSHWSHSGSSMSAGRVTQIYRPSPWARSH